ncbi:hypothetical protein Aperf_G00000120516 [Anoplocephala perfoliata]
MTSDDHSSLEERLKTYPVEGFNTETDVFPYYITFKKDDIEVRVPIAIDANSFRCVQENSSLFINKLKEVLMSKYAESSSTEGSPPLSNLDKSKRYILISDTSKKDFEADSAQKSSEDVSAFDQMIAFRNDFRKIRCFYGLTYDDVSRSIASCYGTQATNHMLYRIEMCSLTAWRHSEEVELIRRWVADMKCPKKRAQLFPPWKLKESLLMKYETLAAKSVTFTNEQEEKLESFYQQNKTQDKDEMQQLKEELGLQVWKIRQWLKARALRDKE